MNFGHWGNHLFVDLNTLEGLLLLLYITHFLDCAPFKEKLTHEGLFAPYNIIIGKTMRDSILAEAEEIMVQSGIITSLDQTATTTDDADLLRFYMKSQSNQDRFFEKIETLRKKSPELRAIFNYEIGKSNARNIKKQLKEQNLKGNFAVLFSQIIASGKTKQELDKNLKSILPVNRHDEVYYIKI